MFIGVLTVKQFHLIDRLRNFFLVWLERVCSREAVTILIDFELILDALIKRIHLSNMLKDREYAS